MPQALCALCASACLKRASGVKIAGDLVRASSACLERHYGTQDKHTSHCQNCQAHSRPLETLQVSNQAPLAWREKVCHRMVHSMVQGLRSHSHRLLLRTSSLQVYMSSPSMVFSRRRLSAALCCLSFLGAGTAIGTDFSPPAAKNKHVAHCLAQEMSDAKVL